MLALAIPKPLTFVCWKWRPITGYRSKFGPDTVNVLYSMIKRYYHGPFEMVCMTDDAGGIRSEVRCEALWTEFSGIQSPHGPAYPSCYRRLKMFSEEGTKLFGPRFVSIDLDVVITADVTPLFDHDLEFKMYGDTAKGTPYNGSIIQVVAGTRSKLWKDFDPLRSPRLGINKRYIGSDQAWIAACLGPNEAKFTRSEGVYSFRNEIQPRGGILPKDARIVIFHGNVDPWLPAMQGRYPWIKAHYK